MKMRFAYIFLYYYMHFTFGLQEILKVCFWENIMNLIN